MRYKVGYWVREFEAIEAEVEKQRAEAKSAAEAGLPPPARTKARTTLTPILVILVYHGKDEWQIPLRFARHLTGMEDPASPLSQVMGRYVPDFEPHFINISAMTDDAIRGEVTTRLMLTVLKYIFADRLDGRLAEIVAMANEVLRLPSGIEMVMALLRYITRSAVKLTRTEITEQLLAYLPKEGGFLMETLAQEWIEEGKSIGFDLGKKEGIGQGIAAQQQTLLHLLQWRFPLSAEAQQAYTQQITRIHDLDHLVRLVNQLLISQDVTAFDQALTRYLPPGEETP